MSANNIVSVKYDQRRGAENDTASIRDILELSPSLTRQLLVPPTVTVDLDMAEVLEWSCRWS